MTWIPIKDALRDGTRYLLKSENPKARYKIVVGKWNVKFNEWQSDPGAWPMRPDFAMSLNDLPPVSRD